MLQENAEHPVDTGDVINGQNEITRLLDSHVDTIAEIEDAWRTVDNTVTQFLSTDHIDQVFQLLEANTGGEISTDNREKKREISAIKQNIRDTINTTIVYSKWNAQLFIQGDSELQDAITEMHASQNTDSTDPYDIHFLELSETVTKAYIRAYTAEQKIIDPLFDLFDEDAQRLEKLAEILTDKTTALDEYTGLLMAIARTHYDPEEDSLIDSTIETLQNYPDFYTPKFMTDTMNTIHAYNWADVQQDIEVLSDTERWVRQFGQFIVTHSLDTNKAVEYLESIDYFELPRSTQNEIKQQLKEYLDDLRKTFIDIIEPFKKPRRFLEKNEPARNTSLHHSRKRTGKRNSRVTPKSTQKRLVCASEQESAERPIDVIATAKETHQGWDGRDIVYRQKETELEPTDWIENAITAVLTLKSFKDYTAKYRNAEDIRKMLEVIITNPKGIGSSIMHGQSIRLFDPHNKEQAKKRQVFHFSPQDCTGIGLSQSPESNRTRIFYCVAGKQLVLLDIQHKTTAEKQRGKFRKN